MYECRYYILIYIIHIYIYTVYIHTHHPILCYNNILYIIYSSFVILTYSYSSYYYLFLYMFSFFSVIIIYLSIDKKIDLFII
ncbi:hypothetical protein BDB01DRAFT_311261 [Pilobolus umbonatus]|nr:hypothetical protein BDB01DRAFT_311261 [Pilobolus umbonatus]